MRRRYCLRLLNAEDVRDGEGCAQTGVIGTAG